MKIKEIAKHLNLSTSTVSRILSNDKLLKVKDETKNKVFSFAIENNFKFKNKNILNEVLIITSYKKEVELEDPYYLNLRAQLEKELIKNLYHFKTVEFKKNMKFKKINILLGSFSSEDLKSINNNNKINILCDSFTKLENIDSISFDYKNSVYDVLNIFIENHHKHIGFIGGRDFNNLIDFREKYFTKFMQKHNLYDKNLIYIDKFNSKTGYDGIKYFFSNNNHPTAIFVANDSIAMGCYKALKEINKNIPNDISIIGFNNSDFSEFMIPALSSVKIFIEHIAYETIILINEHINNKRKYSKKVTLNTLIINRDSVKNIDL